MSVTTDMLAVALGVAAPELDSITFKQWEMWVEDAEMLIETRRLSLTPDTVIDEAKLDYVVREAVVSHIKKPDDATQVQVAVDDGSSTRTYRSGRGRVTILDEWWLLLGLTDPSGAYTIDMLGAANLHLPWCSYNFGALYCSCGVDIAGYPIFENPDDL